MKILDVPFTSVDWSRVDETEYPGETGVSYWRTVESGNIRVRMVRYSPGFKADHWCPRGHVLLVLEGELTAELRDGRKFVLAQGNGFQVSDDDNAHLVYSDKGAKVFIVD